MNLFPPAKPHREDAYWRKVLLAPSSRGTPLSLPDVQDYLR